MRLALRRALFAISVGSLAIGLAACSSNFGGDFFPAKKTNVSLRGFTTAAIAGATATAGGTGGTGGVGGTSGSPAGGNGGTSGPLGGNPTRFSFIFDPFPNGAGTLLGSRTSGNSIPEVSSDNRQRVVNVEVTFRGRDVNNNPVTIVSFLPATGQPDPNTLGTGGGGGVGVGTAASGQIISTLRPSTASVAQTGQTTGVTGVIFEFYPNVQAEFTITNGISMTLNRITLRYFEPDGTLAPISVYDNVINFVMEANPINTGFGTSAGGSGGGGAGGT